MSSTKILVIGATGSVGSDVVRALAKKQVAFRAAVRDTQKAQWIKDLSNKIELAVVDINNEESLVKALNGVESLFLMTPPGSAPGATGTIDGSKKILAAVHKAGSVKHIVKLSAYGIGRKNPTPFDWAEEHLEVEHLIKAAGIPFTSVRPSSFHSNLLSNLVGSIQSQGAIFMPNVRLNYISNEDIGSVIAKSLIEGSPHYGKVYDLLGPDRLNYEELTALISKTVGKEIKYVPLTLDQFKGAMSQYIQPPHLDGLVKTFQFFMEGGYDVSAPSDSDIKTLLGYNGKTLQDFINENKASLTPK